MTHTAVIGNGYTGQRVLKLIPENAATGISRQTLDLDKSNDEQIEVPTPYSVLYTVPPRSESQGEPRIQAFLPLLKTLPQRVVYLSTSGVYGNRNGKIVCEKDPPSPETPRAKNRLIAETMWTDWCQREKVALVILRIPGIYGPGRLGLHKIEARVPVIREEEANPGNRIHVDDLAACCVRALDESTPPGIYNVGDGAHHSSTWFANTVARLATLEPPPQVPRTEAKAAFGAARVSFLNESRILDTTRMLKVLGFTPRYTNPEQGIAASMRTKT